LALLEAGLTHREIFGLTLIPGLLAFAAMGLFVQEPYRHPQADRTLLGDIKGLPRRFVVFVIIAGVFGLGQFAPTLLVLRATELTGSSTRAIELYVLFNIVQAAAAYLSGYAASRARPMLLLAASYLAFALATAGFAVADEAARLIVLFGIAGLAYGGIEAMEPTVAAHVLPSGLRGTGFGALGAANGVGDLLSSVIVGSLWTIVGPAAGFGFAAACSAVSAGGLFILNARKP
jgi:MFS family permease